MRTGPERKPRATREYQPANRREHNITRRRRFTFCPLPVAVTSKKTSEKRSFRPLTNRQPYQRSPSAVGASRQGLPICDWPKQLAPIRCTVGLGQNDRRWVIPPKSPDCIPRWFFRKRSCSLRTGSPEYSCPQIALGVAACPGIVQSGLPCREYPLAQVQC